MGFGSSRPRAMVIPAPFPATSRQTQQANAPSVLFKIQKKSKPVNLPDAHRPQKDPIQLNLIPFGENPAKGGFPYAASGKHFNPCENYSRPVSSYFSRRPCKTRILKHL
jgi:hypothetical protein